MDVCMCIYVYNNGGAICQKLRLISFRSDSIKYSVTVSNCVIWNLNVFPSPVCARSPSPPTTTVCYRLLPILPGCIVFSRGDASIGSRFRLFLLLLIIQRKASSDLDSFFVWQIYVHILNSILYTLYLLFFFFIASKFTRCFPSTLGYC